MQFMVLGYDGTDAEAINRRMAVREEHLKLAGEMHNKGRFLYASAILSDEGQMMGSMIVCDFPSRQELDEWLKIEPYVTGRVWLKVEVHRAQTAAFCNK